MSLLISDANVLIQFYNGGEMNSLALYSREIAPIHVPLTIVEECEDADDGLNEELLVNMGFTIIEPDYDQMQEALQTSEGIAPSPNDLTCYILARDNCAECLTADNPLFNFCKNKGMNPKRSLRILIELKEAALISKDDALSKGRSICDADPAYLGDKIFERLKSELTQSPSQT